MSSELKLRRGSTVSHAGFTGAEGEVTLDTTKDTLVVHDGITSGGFPLKKDTDRGIWAATTVYKKDDVVFYQNKLYICLIAHTSDATFNLLNALEVVQWTVDSITSSTAFAQAVKDDLTARVQSFKNDLAASSGSLLIGFMPVGASSVAATAQAKLRETVSALDFAGVDPTGATDSSIGINAALAYAGSISASKVNHAAVFLPDGAYLASNLEVPLGVVLYGNGPSCCQIICTDLINPAVKINDYTAVKGITFLYPNQTTSGTPTVYPKTITNGSTSPGSYSSIENCRANGAYDFIVLTGCTRFTIRDIDGLPLHIGISLDTFLDAITINNVHFNGSFTSYSATTLAWVFNNAYAFNLKRVDQPKLSNIFAFGYLHGLSIEGGAPSGSANMVEVSNFGFDLCKTPIYLSAHQDGVQFVNGQITSSSGYYGSTGLPCDIGGGVASNQHVLFDNVVFRAFYESIIFATTNIQFSNCVFDDWNVQNVNFNSPAAVYQKTANVILQFSNCKFNLSSREYCRGINEDGTYTGGKVLVSGCVFTNTSSYEVYLPNGRLSVAATELSYFRWGGLLAGTAKDNKLFHGSAPSFGDFLVNDRVYNGVPAAGQPKSWVCVTSGSPGVWASEGNL